MFSARGNSIMSEEDSMPVLVPAEKEPLCKTELAKEQRRCWLLQREGVILKAAIDKEKHFLAKMRKKRCEQEENNRLEDAKMHDILVARGAPDGYDEDSIVVSHC